MYNFMEITVVIVVVRIDSTDFITGPYLLSISVLFLKKFYSLLFLFFGSMQQIKPATR